MKKIYNILAIAVLAVLSACDLDLYPVDEYNEGNVDVDEESETQYSTRADMLGLRNTMYDSWLKDMQEKGIADWLIYSECRADNAYNGSPSTGEIVAIEANQQDAENKNVVRDWEWYLQQISNANEIICNIDDIAENDTSSVTMTTQEHDEWKAEAMCWRAFMLFRMVRLWGDVPVVTEIPPAITAENLEEVYDEYFPARKPVKEVYEQIISDLEYASEYAPDVDVSNKMLFSKAFADGLLARVYAEQSDFQDWTKVAEYCQAVEDMGFSLEPNYGDLWGYDDTDAYRNSAETICEIQWSRSSGNWVFMMFHRNAFNPTDSFTWAKWVTPSRDLIDAYEAEGDTVRMNASIITDACTWSNYWPADSYKFMHKVPTNASSWILMRLGEIYLLHAEALTMTNDLSGAASYVNLVRERAKLDDLPSSATASQSAMLEAVLNERRLELAFEGFRFFDLVRHDMAKEIHDSMHAEDSYWQDRDPLTDETILMPVPQTDLDDNPSLTQNPGY
jgi:hypothetical protein